MRQDKINECNTIQYKARDDNTKHDKARYGNIRKQQKV